MCKAKKTPLGLVKPMPTEQRGFNYLDDNTLYLATRKNLMGLLFKGKDVAIRKTNPDSIRAGMDLVDIGYAKILANTCQYLYIKRVRIRPALKEV